MRFACVVALMAAALPAVSSAQMPLARPARSGTGVIVGQVVDAASGKGIAAAVVMLNYERGALTTNDGRFVFRDLLPGDYRLTASKSGYLYGSYGQRPSGATVPLTLGDGERRADAVIRLWRPASVSGVVVDEAGEPLIGIQVSAIQQRRLAGRLRSTIANSATTDDRGMYRISRLAPGDYVVAMISSQVSIPLSTAQRYDQALISGATAERDNVLQTLARMGASTGTLGGPDARQVGTQVQTMTRNAPTPPPIEGTRLVTYPTLFYPAASSPSSATVISVAAGQERSAIDLQAKPVPVAHVSGIVVGTSAGSAGNLPVRLTMPGLEMPFGFLGAAVTMTDAAGAFTFPAVPAGDYTLRVAQSPHYLPESGGSAIVTSGGSFGGFPPNGPPKMSLDPTLWANVPLSIGDADISGLTVPLHPGSRLSGRIEFEGSREKPPPEQLSRFKFTVTPVDGTQDRGSATPEATCDARGQFKTSEMLGGPYILHVPPSFTGWTLKSIVLGDRDLADLPIDVSSGDISNIVITFTDRAASTIEGTVRGVEGSRDIVSVLIFPTDSKYWGEAQGFTRRLRLTPLTAQATYKIQNVPDGSYYIAAVAEPANGDWLDPKLLEQLSAVATHIEIAEGERVTRELGIVEVKQ
jgi:hypothetical protein